MAGSLGTKRLSMNTSLKNARIFDDDSWDAETAGFTKSTTVDDKNDSKIKIKSEPKEDSELDDSINVGEASTSSIRVKSDKELMYSFTNEEKRHFNDIQIKSEGSSGNLEDSTLNISLDTSNIEKESEEHLKRKILSTPIKKENFQDESNPSPFNKELFRNFSLESPQSKDYVQGGEDRKKAVKRVFEENIKEEETSDECSESGKDQEIGSQISKTLAMRLGAKDEQNKRVSVKKRLGGKQDHNLPQKRPRKEMETDPITLSRRQKQIDYGKNTLGYDNYTKKVPKNERSSDDPKTPNKYVQYSRRAWDGLIKQWRLQLHKYDPVDE